MMNETELDAARAVIAEHDRKARVARAAALEKRLVGKYFKHRDPQQHYDRSWRYFAITTIDDDAQPVAWSFKHHETDNTFQIFSQQKVWQQDYDELIEIEANEFWLAASEVLHAVRDLLERR